MNKAELSAEIATKVGISGAKAEKALAAILDSIGNCLANGDTVSLIGFGSFGVKNRSARKVRNPQTGNEMMVAAKVVPFFKAGTKLKEAVNSKAE